MKKLAVILCLVLCVGLLVGCGAAKCTVEGCEGEAVEDAVFEKQFCAEHLAKKYCAIESCDEVAVEDDAYEDGYCKKHLANKKAFDASKAAYESIEAAYEITEKFGEDIYEAWRMGINEKDEIMDEGLGYLSAELNLTEEELVEGMAYMWAVDVSGLDWDELSEEDKESYRGMESLVFIMFEDDFFSMCVWMIDAAYEVNGMIETAETALNDAKSQMKTLSEEFSDYEHYPNLKGYYTTTSSFFDFCVNPTGSFEQVKTTINDYRNEARDYISDLDYIFEE